MDLVQKFVFWGRGANVPQYLVIHETANPGATALDHVSYWSSGRQNGEAHYVCDWTGKVYHTTPDNLACWHVGGAANSWSVGIELCHATNRADFEKTWRTAVEFAAWYLESQGWGIDRLISHNLANQVWDTYSDHTDPDGYFAEFGKSWQDFVYAVSEEMEDEMATPTEVAEAVWGYNYKGTCRQNNMYDLDNVVYDRVERIEKKLADVSDKIDKIKVSDIDYAKLASMVAERIDKNAIAKAVNDDAAKRKQS